ncbi:MAG: tetratricopeptide repeat protein [Bryobacteraceae bacterium]|jgi:tetratricopeptide (TPR) repeat protein
MRARLIYNCVAVACLCAPLPAQLLPLCPGSQAAPEVAEGVAASKQGQYGEATQHFQAAVALDPACVNARAYLATAYMQQFIPGGDSPENQEFADKATAQYEAVLEQQPENELAISAIASLYFNRKKLDEAKIWYEKLTVVNPDNANAFYTLGVIAWTRSYQPRVEARSKLDMKPEDPGPLRDPEVRQALRTKYLPVVREGIDNINKALEIAPENDDAMAYMNLLYREKADLEDTAEEYRADIAKADEWVMKNLETRKSKATRKQ